MTKGGVELEAKISSPSTTVSRGFSFMDLVLRLVAIVGTMASAIAMGTTNQTLPFFTRFMRFRARFKDLPTFTLFVIANAMVCGYLLLSLGLSILHIVRSHAKNSRIVLIIFDSVMLSFLTAGASASTAIVYLAHQGNSTTNWFAICPQYNYFCERISGSLIGSFVAVAMLIIIIILLSLAISRR